MTYTMESPKQKFGYLEVKQSSKVKGRKLKTWKKRWVVLTKMTDMSSDQIVAKIDLYDNETTWRTDSGQKTTFVLDHVTSIGKTSSRTRPYAFEVCQKNPELVFSGGSEIDSFSWILILQQIFMPELVEAKKDSYHVTIRQNADASRWNLCGEYCLTVSPACVCLNDLDTGNSCISWGLSTLMRFNIAKDDSSEESKVLVIECGKNGPTGESTFEFISSEASEMLNTIRQSICQALSQKQNDRQITTRPRDRSISESNSEKHFRNMLNSTPSGLDPLTIRDRSGSSSSGCTVTPTSPMCPTAGIDNPLIIDPEIVSMSSRKSQVELESLDETDEHVGEQILMDNQKPSDISKLKNEHIVQHQRTSSLPNQSTKGEDHGYAVIKDVEGKGNRSRRNTFSTDESQNSPTTPAPEPVRPPPRKKRTSTINSSKRSVSFEKEDDLSDSAVSSLTLSSSFESTKARGDSAKCLDLDRSMEDTDSGTDISPQPYCLNRRRSSSTPDLPAFWLANTNLENVYEELDAIRSSKQNLPSNNCAKETPPALPARPFHLILPSQRIDECQPIFRLKKIPFFNRHKMQHGKSMLSVEVAKSCCCNYPYISSNGLLLSKNKCVVCKQCGGNLDTKDGETKHEPQLERSNDFKSSNSSINNPYASISDINRILAKRRRSSDTTQQNTFLENGDSGYEEPRKSSSLPRNISNQANDSNSSKIDNDSSNSGSFASQKPSMFSSGGKNDPLISFFIDDDKFQSNPMVTGRLSGSRRHSNGTDLLICPDSPGGELQGNFFSSGIFTTQSNDILMSPSDELPPGSISPDPFSMNPFTINHTLSPLMVPFTNTSTLSPFSVTYTSLTHPAHTPDSSSFPMNPNTQSPSTPITKISPVNKNPSSTITSCNSSPESVYCSMQTKSENTRVNESSFSTNASSKLDSLPTGGLFDFTTENPNWFNNIKDNSKTRPDVILSSQISSDKEDLYVAPKSVQRQPFGRPSTLDLN